MSVTDQTLLEEFVRENSQDAFTALVKRHLNLVYCAALRQVRSPHLAEEISQSVFVSLARNAAGLQPDTVLTAWLYQVTRNLSVDVVRREARRRAREQIAHQMSEINDTSTDWADIEPLLDEAMHSLDEKDRTAVLLRYFENKSLREVGLALGASEDAAQKRVSRAVERLSDFFSNRKITVGTGGLAALVSVHAVQAAPASLAGSIVTNVCLSLAGLSTTSTALAVTKTIAMTTTQKTLIIVALAGAVITGLYQARQVSTLRQQVQTLKNQQELATEAARKKPGLQTERDQAKMEVASLSAPQAVTQKSSNEVLKLRGEVGRLRQENATMASSSALSKVTANPESRKMLRDQQKLGMSAVYKGFAQTAKLNPEQAEKLNDLLADHIMENVNHVTTILRDKPTPEQMNELFASQESALNDKIQDLLGPDGLSHYQEYTRNLLPYLTAEQFKGMLSGEPAVKEQKSKQLAQLMQEEVQAALASAALPPDYQTVPMLNFRNIASEQEGEKSLKLLDEIYAHVAARGTPILTAEELGKFQEFKTAAINNNRSALSLNRTLMAPISGK